MKHQASPAVLNLYVPIACKSPYELPAGADYPDMASTCGSLVTAPEFPLQAY